MSELADIISEEFEDALEVKNPKSLHRGIFLLLSSTVPREEHSLEHEGLKKAIAELSRNVELIAIRMEEGFKRMDNRFETMERRTDDRFEASEKRFEMVDKRFEMVDKRFEALDKRFNRQTTLLSIGFLVIATLITVYQFLG